MSEDGNPGINTGAIISSRNQYMQNMEGGGGTGEFGLNKEVTGVLAGQVFGGQGIFSGNITDMFEMKGGILQVFPFESFTSGIQSVFGGIIDAPLQSVGNIVPKATPIASMPSPHQAFVGGSKGGQH